MTNKNWGTLEGSTPTYAETWVKLDGKIIINPTDEQYRAAGKLPIVSPSPNPPAGQHVSGSSWSVVDGVITKSWTYEKDLDPVYIYSKKKFFLALAKRGIFKEVKEWMDATEVIEGTGLTVSFLLSESTYMKSDDSDFLAIKAVADAKFGADKFAEVLQESIDEG